jgi:hypothetical protein
MRGVFQEKASFRLSCCNVRITYTLPASKVMAAEPVHATPAFVTLLCLQPALLCLQPAFNIVAGSSCWLLLSSIKS